MRLTKSGVSICWHMERDVCFHKHSRAGLKSLRLLYIRLGSSVGKLSPVLLSCPHYPRGVPCSLALLMSGRALQLVHVVLDIGSCAISSCHCRWCLLSLLQGKWCQIWWPGPSQRLEPTRRET